ncbi:MAG: hypothetical protein SXG53_17560 [Pseudomonadota bacterium]|nr:hypothetical protein [Pseudomonadota bacterium]
MASILVSFFLLCVFLGIRYSAVVDMHIARSLFSSKTKFLQIPQYRSCHARLTDAGVPPEVCLLAEFLLQQFDAGKRTVAITSASANVGKTTITMFLARAIAVHVPVIVHDADLRHRASKVFADLRDEPRWNDLDVKVNSLPHNQRLIELVRQRSRPEQPALELFDCSPTFTGDGGLSVAREVDLVILVFEELQSRADLNASLSDLTFFEVTPHVVVINKARRRAPERAYSYLDTS